MAKIPSTSTLLVNAPVRSPQRMDEILRRFGKHFSSLFLSTASCPNDSTDFHDYYVKDASHILRFVSSFWMVSFSQIILRIRDPQKLFFASDACFPATSVTLNNCLTVPARRKLLADNLYAVGSKKSVDNITLLCSPIRALAAEVRSQT